MLKREAKTNFIATGMMNGTHYFNKQIWKEEMWKNAWLIDNDKWKYTACLFADTYYLKMTLDRTDQYLIWREISNNFPEHMQMCETSATLVRRASNLKADNIECKGANLSIKACPNCNLFQEENLEHVIIFCPNNDYVHTQMMTDIHMLEERYEVALTDKGTLINNLVGGQIVGIDPCIMNEFWLIAGEAINKMYMRIETAKTGYLCNAVSILFPYSLQNKRFRRLHL